MSNGISNKVLKGIHEHATRDGFEPEKFIGEKEVPGVMYVRYKTSERRVYGPHGEVVVHDYVAKSLTKPGRKFSTPLLNRLANDHVIGIDWRIESGKNRRTGDR